MGLNFKRLSLFTWLRLAEPRSDGKQVFSLFDQAARFA